MAGPAEWRARGDGGYLLRSVVPPAPLFERVGDVLELKARTHTHRPFLVEVGADGSQRPWTYGEIRERVDETAARLLGAGLRPGERLWLVAEPSVDHAVVQFAAARIGVVTVPLSPLWAAPGADPSRLAETEALTRPAAYWAAEDVQGVAPRCPRLRLEDVEPAGDSALREAASKVHAETPIKLLMTSGSTRSPKAVINTHRMLCANQASIAALWPFLAHDPPVVVDWLPWSHTFGGNHNLHLVLWHGGTLWLTPGRPTVDRVTWTLRDLTAAAPTCWFDVPRGFDLLVPLLEADPAAAQRLCSRLRLAFFAGAPLSAATWERLSRLLRRHAPRHPLLVTGWGTTETAPMAVSSAATVSGPEVLGLPVPGVDVALLPAAGGLELCVRGPSVTPGYFGGAPQDGEAFDAEGFFHTGDLARLVDPTDPSAGLVFAGRAAESFKLASGTWVHPSEVRAALLPLLARDVLEIVVLGPGRSELAVLAFARDPDAPWSEVALRLHEGLTAHDATRQGSSRRVARLAFVRAPLAPAHGEITEKGTVNVDRVLALRAGVVARLDAGLQGAPRVIDACDGP